jgi:hypothetical protein
MPLTFEIGDAVRALAETRRLPPPSLLVRPIAAVATEIMRAVPTAVVPVRETAISSAFHPIETIAMSETTAMLETVAMLGTEIVPRLAVSKRLAMARRGEAPRRQAAHIAAIPAPP